MPGHRPADVSCGADDVLVFGFPVYAGRVPALLRDEFAHLIGQDTPAVIVGLYGNRDFDDALLEAADLLGERGFDVAAAGARSSASTRSPRAWGKTVPTMPTSLRRSASVRTWENA